MVSSFKDGLDDYSSTAFKTNSICVSIARSWQVENNRSKCIGKSDFKKIDDTVDKALYDRMHARLQTTKAKRMKKLRSSTVEPVLGTLINYLNLRRVNTRGIRQANKCMLMAAVAYNLKKLMKFSTLKALTDIKALQKTMQDSFSSLLTTIKHDRFLFTPAFKYFH